MEVRSERDCAGHRYGRKETELGLNYLKRNCEAGGEFDKNFYYLLAKETTTTTMKHRTSLGVCS